MKIYHYSLQELGVKAVDLGKRGENKVREIEFDLRDWIAEYPGASVALYVSQPNTTVYLAATKLEEGILKWPILNTYTATPGFGSIEVVLSGKSGERLKSATANIFVSESMSEDEQGEAPEYMKPYADQVAENAAKAEKVLEEIKNIGTQSGNMPTGGEPGQILAKKSEKDYDTHWVDPPSGSGTGNGTVTGVKIGDASYTPNASGMVDMSGMTAPNAASLNGKSADEYATVEQLNNKQFSGLVTSSTDIYARNERMYPGIDIYGTDREGNKSFQGSLRLSMNTDHDGFRDVELIDSGQTKICRVLTEAYGTAADSAKLGGKEPKYYTQPRNLLDNSWWKVKKEIVNQRGQTIYTGDGYTIDRWTIWGVNGDASLTVNDSGLTFNPGSGGGTLSQKIPLGILESAKTYTLAVHKSNGETEVKTDGVTFNHNGECDLVTVSGVAETILWAALYEGEYTADNLPPYVPKGYAVELAECMRYYRLLKIGGAVNGNYIGYRIPISPTMRTNPTVERSQIGTSSGQAVITAGGYTSESISLRLDAYIESTTEKWWTDDVVLSADL